MTRLQEFYKKTVVPQMRARFGYQNVMQVPRITKIVLNMGVGEAMADKKVIEHAVSNMAQIAGQKPLTTRSRKSIANFKVRENWPIGCMVTLRGTRMYEFLDRLISIAIPRIRDFRGLSARAFDGRGNYSLGIKEQIIFPEIDFDKVDAIRGMDITIVTTARNDAEARALLEAFSFPLRADVQASREAPSAPATAPTASSEQPSRS
ncbi:MAG: 50S ribosomal protein L5 [Gammaproteobacteria bacterium]|nr:50S ribosomal protein L5 [Gammaproteobacteria bacterium]